MKNSTLQKIRQATACSALLFAVGLGAPAYAQEQFLGEIRMFTGNFAPRGWALAQGQIMFIAQNPALFSILGTTYGGNGQTTFALPNLQGRVPIGVGGSLNANLGSTGGQTYVTLNSTQLPAHNHSLNVSSNAATTSQSGTDKVLAVAQNAGIYSTEGASTTLNPTSIGIAGNSAPVSTMPPYLTINYIIALEGIYPTRE